MMVVQMYNTCLFIISYFSTNNIRTCSNIFIQLLSLLTITVPRRNKRMGIQELIKKLELLIIFVIEYTMRISGKLYNILGLIF